MNVHRRLEGIVADVARSAKIEPTPEGLSAHAESLERWNDRQWNAVGSDSVLMFSALRSVLWMSGKNDTDPRLGCHVRHAMRAAMRLGQKSIAKRLARVSAHLIAIEAQRD